MKQKLNTKKKWLIPLGMWLVFEIVAATLWLNKDNLFYLLNFSYIGSAIALGLLLFQLNYRHARRIGFIRYITFTASLVFMPRGEYRANYVLGISCWQYPVLCHWNHSGICVFGIIGHSVNISAQLPYS